MPTEFKFTNEGCVEYDKADKAILFLREMEKYALEKDPRGYMLGYSGGKDSTVLAQLFKEAGVKYFLIHNITGIDPPELVYFKRRQFAKLEGEHIFCMSIQHPKSIIQICEQQKLAPIRTKRFCCEYLKEYRPENLKNCVCSFGVRKYESLNREAKRDELEIQKSKKKVQLFTYDNDENRKQFETCYASGFREMRVNPIAYWTDADVWDFIYDRKLQYCELYDEGWDRLGCVGCPCANKQRKTQFERWPGLKRVWIIAFEKIWEAREIAGMKRLCGCNSALDMFNWWMEDLPSLELQIEGQMEFE